MTNTYREAVLALNVTSGSVWKSEWEQRDAFCRKSLERAWGSQCGGRGEQTQQELLPAHSSLAFDLAIKTGSLALICSGLVCLMGRE